MKDDEAAIAAIVSADPARDAAFGPFPPPVETQPALTAREEAAVLRRVRRTLRPGARVRRGLLVGAGVAAVLACGAATGAVAVRSFVAPLSATQATPEPSAAGAADGEQPDGWKDSADPTFVAVLMSEYPAWLPLPDGVAADDVQRVVAQTVADGLGEHPGYVEEGYLAGVYEMTGVCLWQEVYLDALERSDASVAAEAVDAMSAAPDWPAIVATDQGGGLVQPLRDGADRARAGDPGGVRAMHTMCGDTDLGDFRTVGGNG